MPRSKMSAGSAGAAAPTRPCTDRASPPIAVRAASPFGVSPALRAALRRTAASLAGACALMLAAGPALAEFPEKPIKVVSPYAPGNTLDIPLLQLNEFMRQATGQQVVIEHKPGAAAMVGTQAVANAPGDGYTMLLGPMGVFVINPHTFSKLSYSPDKSFKPVTNFMGAPLLFVVNSQLPVNSLQELVAYAKKNPGQPSYGSFGAGNSSHFAGALLNQRAGISMLHVPFNGTPPLVQNLVSGQVMSGFIPYIAARPHLESGKIRALAYSAKARAAQLPNVPTFSELGFPDLEINMWTGLFVPASTPDAVVKRLNGLITQALGTQAMREKVLPNDVYPLPTTPEEFASFIATDSKKWAEAVRLTGFKAQE